MTIGQAQVLSDCGVNAIHKEIEETCENQIGDKN